MRRVAAPEFVSGSGRSKFSVAPPASKAHAEARSIRSKRRLEMAASRAVYRERERPTSGLIWREWRSSKWSAGSYERKLVTA